MITVEAIEPVHGLVCATCPRLELIGIGFLLGVATLGLISLLIYMVKEK